MANGYPAKTSNCTIYRQKAKEKWDTQQLKLQVRK